MWEGPLWKARLVFRSDKRCRANRAALIFAMQHAITDGITYTRICKETINNLNQIIAEEVSDLEKLPYMTSIEQFLKVPSILTYWAGCLKSTCFDLTHNFGSNKAELGISPLRNDIKKGETKSLFAAFTEEETKHLLKKCKSRGVTLNSLVTTMINFAIMDHIQEKRKCPPDKIIVRGLHCVDLRRHYSNDYKDILGCHVSFLDGKVILATEDAKQTWKTVSKIDESIKKDLSDRKHIPVISVLGFSWLLYVFNSWFTKFGLKNNTKYTYISSNIGNLTQLQPEETSDRDVQIRCMFRSSQQTNGVAPLIFAYHTFKNQLTMTTDYFTNKVRDVDAKSIFHKLCVRIKDVSHDRERQEDGKY